MSESDSFPKIKHRDHLIPKERLELSPQSKLEKNHVPQVPVVHRSLPHERVERRPQQRPNLPQIPTSWVGVDRKDIPKNNNGTANIVWMSKLLANPNIQFSGAYVTGLSFPPTSAPGNFKWESKATNRMWMPNIQVLSDMGYGIIFFYFGFSSPGASAQPIGVAGDVQHRERGRLHGLHLKLCMKDQLDMDKWAGAVVFIDNEDPEDKDLSSEMEQYYLGIFDAVSEPSANDIAFRPGLYGHGKVPTKLVEDRPDLFHWDPTLDTVTTTTSVAPFEFSDDPIRVNPAARPIRSYPIPGKGHLDRLFVTYPLGRQFRFYVGSMPKPGSPISIRLRDQPNGPVWQPISPWDYNVSFVRNPAFPIAEPRIAVCRRGREVVVLRGSYRPGLLSNSGDIQRPPAMEIHQVSEFGERPLITDRALVEPEAPMILCLLRDKLLMFTILSSSDIGEANQTKPLNWSSLDLIKGKVPRIRRIRTMAAVSPNGVECHLFLVGADQKLYRKIRNGDNMWTDHEEIKATHGTVPRLHPFSGLTVCRRQTDLLLLDIFFINENGLLTAITWIDGTPPTILNQKLEQNPSLLPGSALIAISPQGYDVLIFGIGTDLHVKMSQFTREEGWIGPSSIGYPKEQVGPHARLAVNVVSPTELELVTLTDAGQAVVYSLHRKATASWIFTSRYRIPHPSKTTPGKPQPKKPPLAPADGYSINPYGDIAISREPGSTESIIYCTGLKDGQNSLIRRQLDIDSNWEVYTA